MDGLINIDKPSGLTSSKVVQVVRRKLNVKTAGHMGTLDPMGSGILLVGLGKGARLFDYYLKKDKTYISEFEFGYECDTLDNTGMVTARTEQVPALAQINGVLPSFVGKQLQMPPAYSAKSVGGRRAYDLARSGEAVELKPSEIIVHSIKCLKETAKNTYAFEIKCGAGTYIRSLCRDIAYAVGSLASMVSIRRTQCGEFLAENAVPLDNVTENDVLPLEKVISLPRYDADENDYKKLCNGVRISADGAPDGLFVLYCKGELFGIAENDNGIRIKTYLRKD